MSAIFICNSYKFNGRTDMGKILSIIGYLILGFIVLSNYINIQLSTAIIILLSVTSVIFMAVGILIKEKN